MRPLILCSHYPPRRSLESVHTLLLCERLGARGIEVDLLTSKLLPDFPTPKGFRLHPRMKSWGWHQFPRDRKSTRLNSSHDQISYAVFCLKKKKNNTKNTSHHKT